MAGQRIRSMVIRQWDLIVQIGGTQRGMTIHQLEKALGASRSTVYRDLEILTGAGVPIVTEKVNGEARYKLVGSSYPPLMPTPLQVAALHLARSMMEPLAGTRLVVELDALLARISPTRALPEEPVSLGPLPPGAPPEHMRMIDRALRDRKRLAFIYQSVSQEASTRRRVDPIGIRLNDGQLYLNAYDLERAALRTFKIARLCNLEILDEDAPPHPEYDERSLFAHSAKVWTGAPVHVRVRLSPRVARFAGEWPLAPAQEVTVQDDGSAQVSAHVAGTVEAMRWVLSWGREAEALAPPELRAAMSAELVGALDCYQLAPERGDPPPDDS